MTKLTRRGVGSGCGGRRGRPRPRAVRPSSESAHEGGCRGGRRRPRRLTAARNVSRAVSRCRLEAGEASGRARGATSSEGRGIGTRRTLRRADPGPHDQPRQGVRHRHVPDLQRGEQRRLHRGRPGEWSDTGPTALHRPTRRSCPSSPRQSPCSTRCRRRCRSTRPGRPQGARIRRPDARDVDPRQLGDTALPQPRRRQPGRSSEPSRATSRCSSSSSTSPPPVTRRTSARSSATSTRATARRCSGCGQHERGGGEDGPGARAQACGGTPSPWIVQSRGGVCRDRQAVSEGQARHRRRAAGACRQDRLPARLLFQRDQLTQRMGQGTLTKVSARRDAVLARRRLHRDRLVLGSGFPCRPPSTAPLQTVAPAWSSASWRRQGARVRESLE